LSLSPKKRFAAKGGKIMRSWRKKFFLLGAVIIFTVALTLNPFSTTFAAAQEGKPKQDRADKEYELETITVTAQKQEENVQEVPISVSVFNELDIEDKKIESVRDMVDFVPNLALIESGSSGANSPSMRGIYAGIESLTKYPPRGASCCPRKQGISKKASSQ
jgi:iron complex outermembrane receptor protein